MLRTATVPGDWVSGRLNPSAQISSSTWLAKALALPGSSSASVRSIAASICGLPILPKLLSPSEA
ncbi:Uncharacterised protein [Mycobacterium tuberculosis]|nr:Uncharacterised protein [Mycobacterium tuberculosis]